MPAEKLPVKFTVVQQLKQLEERIQLENHHESSLPSQRYRVSRQFPLKLNPIVPQDVGAYADESNFPAGFLAENAPKQRPAQLGNPIFGYSGHPLPAPVVDDLAPGRMTQQGSKVSSEAMSRLKELQGMLQQERKLRRELEAELAAIRR